jgi:lysophospholipase L1-like esterase
LFSQDPPRIGYMVNRRPRLFSPVFPLGLSVQESALPLLLNDANARLVTLRTRATGLVGTGTWLRAFYLPLNCSARLFQRASSRTMVVIADSIATSFATDPQWTCWVAALRERYPGTVLLHGAPGQQLHDFAANIPAAAQQVGRAAPSDVYLALGTNDFAFASWSAADFGTGLTSYVDNGHVFAPQARWWLQSPLRRTAPANENAFAPFNNTLSDYGAYYPIVANDPSRVLYTHFLDGKGTGFPAVPSVDGIHPGTDQHGQIASTIISAFVAAGIF